LSESNKKKQKYKDLKIKTSLTSIYPSSTPKSFENWR